MLGSASPIYEIVSGQIKLGKREDFRKIHQEILLPILENAGIKPVSMLVTETGYYDRFLNIYRYADLHNYGQRTDIFAQDNRVGDYFSAMLPCLEGSLQVELALELFSHPDEWH